MSTATAQSESTAGNTGQVELTEIRTVAARLVELWTAGRNLDAMRALYSADIVSVEGDGSETVGRTAVIQKSERWADDNAVGSRAVRGPFFNAADDTRGRFAVVFDETVTRRATGETTRLEEVGVYTVEDGKIAREEFFLVS